MRNRLSTLLAEGQPCIGAQMRSGSPALAELFGCAGFDYLVFAAEHAPQTPPMLLAQIQALASTSATLAPAMIAAIKSLRDKGEL